MIIVDYACLRISLWQFSDVIIRLCTVFGEQFFSSFSMTLFN